jgi:hypothetical protein
LALLETFFHINWASVQSVLIYRLRPYGPSALALPWLAVN